MLKLAYPQTRKVPPLSICILLNEAEVPSKIQTVSPEVIKKSLLCVPLTVEVHPEVHGSLSVTDLKLLKSKFIDEPLTSTAINSFAPIEDNLPTYTSDNLEAIRIGKSNTPS